MKRRSLALLIVLVLVVSVVFTACGKDNTDSNATTTNTASNTAGNSTATAKPEEPKITMTLFMSNSGLPHPDGVDASNNEFVNIIEKYANVDLVIEVPGYADVQTKLNLLLSSGNLPDIVHSSYLPDTIKRAEEGAFIDLKKYYDNSPVLKKHITPEMLEFTKSTKDGKYYRMPMSVVNGPMGSGVVARWDLVKKYNNNKWPESLDEWITVFRAMKKAEPDSIVLSNRVVGANTITYSGVPIFAWHGAIPYGVRYEYDTGNVVSTFTLPEYKAATLVMKQMFDEGILEKEFATIDNAKWLDRLNNRNLLVHWNSTSQYTPERQVSNKQGAVDPKTKTYEYMYAPLLKKDPVQFKDQRYVQTYAAAPVNAHGMYISTSGKNQDRAWKVIEGFACDELFEAIHWGKEGETYKVENNKRVPIPAKLSDPKRSWSLHLGTIFGFVNAQDLKRSLGELGTSKEFSDAVFNTITPIDTMARKNGLAPTSFTVLSADAAKKNGDTLTFISQATVELIMGKISPDQFDQKVKDFQKEFGFIYEEHTKYIKDNKAEIMKKGVKF